MADRLKSIQAKVLEWWNKFTTKQRIILIGIVGAVVLTVVFLTVFFSQPQYVFLIDCENTEKAAEVLDVLDGAGISYRTSTSGLRIEVERNQESAANIALGAEGFQPSDYDADLFNTSFSTTESDKQKQWVIYLEKKLSADLESYVDIKSANVIIDLPIQNGTLIAQNQQATAYISLELTQAFSADKAANIAQAVATALGNDSTANITITDTSGNMLFSGASDQSIAGSINAMLNTKQQQEEHIASQVKELFNGLGYFDNIEVQGNLVMDPSSHSQVITDYSTETGREEGYIIHSDNAETENSSISGGPPGTDSNNETTNMYEDNDSNNSSSSQSSIDRIYDSDVQQNETPIGAIDYDNSTLALTALRYKELHEEDVRAQGLLDGTTWEAYKDANSEMTPITVEDGWVNLAANATGFPAGKITLLAYENPMFFDAPASNINTSDILSIVMFVIILALLAFVVLSTMRGKRVEEGEEELSVESLLQSSPEVLEEIELDDKSETRKMIEKFVDENPEAVANLLRNWLQDDW
jgi:flagellar M-ring protein FliF